MDATIDAGLVRHEEPAIDGVQELTRVPAGDTGAFGNAASLAQTAGHRPLGYGLAGQRNQ